MKLLTAACLAALLWLTGCASTPTPSSSPASEPPTGTAPVGTSRPALSLSLSPPSGLQPIAASSWNSRPVAQMAAPADLWQRIRMGFAMPDLNSDLVRDREQWYTTRPDYIFRMTERSRKYLFHIVEELERRGMPTELALLPYIESAFNPQAVSSAKAAGMWQFMPATGTSYDLKQNVFRDDRRDVLASTRAALDYLQRLYGMFGDWHLALAAYNWGEGNVGKAIARNQKQGLGTGYLDLNMPNETRYYVPKLQAVKNIVANPELFRAELPDIPNHPYFETVDIPGDIDVALAAKLADVPLADFKALNPSVHRPVILAAGTPQILLPWDNASIFKRNLEAYHERLASWTAWTAPSTMSVASAAQRVGMSEYDLRNINNIPPRMLIKAGSALIVTRLGALDNDVTGRVAETGQLSLAPEIVTRRTTIKSGRKDTVVSIAQRYKVSISQVADWNDVKSGAAFKPGQSVVLYLPMTARASAPSSPQPSAAKPVRSLAAAAPAGRSAHASAKQPPIRAAAPAPAARKKH
ncbi:transglycosylase SLT domain-containing protein [Curvibacter sp. RS43]|uniref:transglycosylase SLT domain-containing protein n=1 Tax=Curvibacter microcysteis TaxID=3026419 RepID=UPI00235F1E96|nr:transglycosylase SLT domain-containing protein [Curvibacter sp. RS43]MDD0809121.1 transglycosylase SLT domain-containing protein [Curvibacter sp. RS43]